MQTKRSQPLSIIGALLAILSIARAQTPTTAPVDLRDDASPWGISTSAEWANEFPKFDPLLQTAGARWLRIYDEWQRIEPHPGEWVWDFMDAKVADARANHMHLTGGFWYFAPWSSAKGDTRSSPIKDMQFWRDYVAANVTRYQKDIKYWEVWNEFNGSFAVSKNKPKDYADLVREAYDSAKKIDPTCKVGISCANFDVGFFDAAIKAGAADHFDFVCVHPYENLGLAAEGNEASYLSLAGSLRKMLADNHQPADLPLWITEVGSSAPITVEPKADQAQAEALVKGFVLSMVEGFQRIFWFEARGPSYGRNTDLGIIRADWTPRPSYDALKTMTGLLGPEPKYEGWLDLGGSYGFVFQGKDGDVLAAWSPSGLVGKVTFTAGVRCTDLAGKETPLSAGQDLALSPTPLFVSTVPADLVQQARQNTTKPFPWGSDYTNAETVSCRLGGTNVNKGIDQVHMQNTKVVNFLEESSRSTDRFNRSLHGEGNYAYFRVDPTFATFGVKELEITVVARSADPDKTAKLGITYESLKGYMGAKGAWDIPKGNEWAEKTWTVDNANFVGGWGWNFRIDVSNSPSDCLIKEVRVKRVVKKN